MFTASARGSDQATMPPPADPAPQLALPSQPPPIPPAPSPTPRDSLSTPASSLLVPADSSPTAMPGAIESPALRAPVEAGGELPIDKKEGNRKEKEQHVNGHNITPVLADDGAKPAQIATKLPSLPRRQVIYDPTSVPNPSAGSKRPVPVFPDGLPSDMLFRPERLPRDLDGRLNRESIWAAVDQTSGHPVYFVPSSCGNCRAPQANAYCDRGYPACSRCSRTSTKCQSGQTWVTLVPPKIPTSIEARRFTANEKGKGRANPNPSPSQGHSSTVQVPVSKAGTGTGAAFIDDIGRGKRVKKKRRLSASGEIDPESVKDDGTTVFKRPKPRPSLPATLNGSVSGPSPSPGTGTGSGGGTLNGTARASFRDIKDEAYHLRLEANKLKPILSDMRASCPVWSLTMRGLQAGVEYMRNPVQTAGASVDIEPGGLARGVILQGVPPSSRAYWGEKGNTGTIVVSIGYARPRYHTPSTTTTPHSALSPKMPSHGLSTPENLTTTSPLHTPTMTSTNDVLDAAQQIGVVAPAATSPPRPFNGLVTNPGCPPPSQVIVALLQTHRARTPIALGVAQDYTVCPFKVPRAFIILGWFWIVDAWVEPVYNSANAPDRTRSVWQFRFEWCSGTQGDPWWQSETEPRRRAPSPPLGGYPTEPWTVKDPNPSKGLSTTFSPLPEAQSIDLHSRSDSGPWRCPACQGVSERVYFYQDICLNETCDKWFLEAPSSASSGRYGNPDPTLAMPGIPPPKQRIQPEQLGLLLRPPEPAELTHEATSSQAGQSYWQGWVCHSCGLAGERNKWSGWECEACKNTIHSHGKWYSAHSLRPPSRPVSHRVRQDEGFANFDFPTTRAWALFTDEVKVVKHDLSETFGAGAEIYHALAHEGGHVQDFAHRALIDLQREKKILHFKRSIASAPTARAADRYLSSFYTLLCGPEPVPSIESIPSEKSVPWTSAPDPLIDIADLINERAGRMFPGEPERFNSLLVVASPPALPTASAPRIYIPPHTLVAYLILGSECTIKFRTSTAGEKKGKWGEMIAQHGDVIGLRSSTEAVEVVLSPDGFGFICIARQVYRDIIEQETQTRAQSLLGSENPLNILEHEADSRRRVRLQTNSPPPKPTKLAQVPLTFWYIGPYPLDPKQAFRATATATATEKNPLAPDEPMDVDVDGDAGAGTEKETGSIVPEGEIRYTGRITVPDLPTLSDLYPPAYKQDPGGKSNSKSKTGEGQGHIQPIGSEVLLPPLGGKKKGRKSVPQS